MVSDKTIHKSYRTHTTLLIKPIREIFIFTICQNYTLALMFKTYLHFQISLFSYLISVHMNCTPTSISSPPPTLIVIFHHSFPINRYIPSFPLSLSLFLNCSFPTHTHFISILDLTFPFHFSNFRTYGFLSRSFSWILSGSSCVHMPGC